MRYTVHVIVRFAALGRAILRREKVQHEAAVMNYLRRTTSIPIPAVIGPGICRAGPHIVMSFIDGEPLSDFLKDPSVRGRPSLNPQISDRSLKRAFYEMARLVLELSRLAFDTIGAMEEIDGNFAITKQPLTFDMNKMMASQNLPHVAFPSRTFRSAIEYFEALATQHIATLHLQQNNAVDAEDCRKKYTARFLFLNITRHLLNEYSQDPFRLCCDDFRPSNVLMNLADFSMSGVTDWEFTYAAPAEFTNVAPWWLLLQSPEDWPEDLNEFLGCYKPRLRAFLEATREIEDKMIDDGYSFTHQRLSSCMEQSMENGLFRICPAARSNTMFDEIY